jgi:hypothetical protein
MSAGERDRAKRRVTFMTPHEVRRLDWACAPVRRVFGAPFLVGSVLTSPDYRDIDIRLVLPDDEFDALTGGSHARHMLLNVAFTDLIARAANAPASIDFQFQAASDAEAFEGQPRNPLGVRQ